MSNETVWLTQKAAVISILGTTAAGKSYPTRYHYYMNT